jgi:hypothetical protein
MTTFRARRAVFPALVLSSLVPLAVAVPATAGSSRTFGTGKSVNVGWTEYDPNDVLGLPGNVHIGYLYAEVGPYGTYTYGNVTDFECDEGETPWGGHGVADALAQVANEGADVVEGATEDSIDAVVKEGRAVIDSGAVVDAIAAGIADEVPDEIIDEVPVCDYVQDRFLDGTDTATLTVDLKRRVATISGQLIVYGGHGEHGEPGTELGRPPINVTITGGDWNKFEWSYSSRGEGWFFSDRQKGTGYHGGAVTGGIGAMGFADDVDDESWGGFTEYSYKTVERIR